MNFLLYACLSLSLIYATLGKNTRVIGGNSADIREFPHQVAFIYLNANKIICGGSIISNWHILTAAHCFYQKEQYIPDTRAFTGTTNMEHLQGTGYPIETPLFHPDYTGEISGRATSLNDVAVVKLGIAIIFNQFQNKASLPQQSVIPGSNVFVTGWGSVNREANYKLQKAQVKIMANSDCNRYYNGNIQNTQFCVISRPGVGVCTGDSGGPVTQNGVVVGIISVNTPCARGIPDVAVNVYSYLNFILPIIRQTQLS